MDRIVLIGLLVVLSAVTARAQDQTPPACYANLRLDDQGRPVAVRGETTLPLRDETPRYTLRQLRGNPEGLERGIKMTFVDPENPDAKSSLAGGRVYYALIDPRERFPMPKFRRGIPIDRNGVAEALITGRYDGRYDYVDWARRKRGAVYYRVVDAKGKVLYEGRAYFRGAGPFKVDPGSIIEGPFVNLVSHESAVISFESLAPGTGHVVVPGVGEFEDAGDDTHHEIAIGGLQPDTEYEYTVSAGGLQAETYSFRTAPAPGTRKPFLFAFASDSRSNIPSGERNVGGTNAYMMKRIMALVTYRKAAFFQFTGDMIDGYRNNVATQRVEYANWKRAILPWASRVPVIAGMGNHEALLRVFDDGSKYGTQCDRFPFETDSAEAVFAREFVNPTNGPESEDGASYDPSPDKIDFPSYKENVYFYTYDNVAMVVLNSNYWYSPSVQYANILVGGNPHGYLMDNQLAWLRKTLAFLEGDENIDHVFVTHHTPAFPNGGHVADDMFYGGRNEARPWIAGKPHPKGIIERRDEYWRILMDSPKVYAVLAGDEHNYSRLEVKKDMPVYNRAAFVPDDEMVITRSILHITNGAAGAPYYAREETPWNRDFDPKKRSGHFLRRFTTQNAVVFFHVNGKEITIEVVNPDSLERIE